MKDNLEHAPHMRELLDDGQSSANALGHALKLLAILVLGGLLLVLVR